MRSNPHTQNRSNEWHIPERKRRSLVQKARRHEKAVAKREWIKGAIKRPGAFRGKARAAGMSTMAYARKVLKKGSTASERTKKQARLALTLSKLGKKRS